MKSETLWRLFVAATCGALLGSAQAAGDPKAGKFKFDTCKGCHAIPGYTNVYPTYHVPRLGGQHAEYIIAALNEYKTGNRQHPTMTANAFDLSDQDMADIAAYVAAVKPVEEKNPITGDVESGKKKAQTCAACHGPDGNGPAPSFPRLAGQHEDYLIKSLQDYKSGKRKNPIMNAIAAPLSATDIANLSAYFASQPKGLAAVYD